MISLQVNAQEVIDTPVEVAIEEVAVQELPADVPQEEVVSTTPEIVPSELPVIEKPIEVSVASEVGPVDVTRDDKRLEIMAFQALSYESTGEYTQIKDAQVVEGDVIGFEASMVGVVEPTEEIWVYDAPCGKGWQLIVYDNTVTVESWQIDRYGNRVQAFKPIVRSYGYGCEHESRTFNW